MPYGILRRYAVNSIKCYRRKGARYLFTMEIEIMHPDGLEIKTMFTTAYSKMQAYYQFKARLNV